VNITVEATSLEELKTLLEQLTAHVPSRSNCHIAALPLNVRTLNCLRAEGIETLEQLSMMSPTDLLKVPNLGRTSVAEIRAVLNARGFA
jgi:DNA-directed RNA polymerase alpha subunit